MGSQKFSVDFLDLLLKNNFEIVAVFTREPKLAGRGKKLTKTVVHEYAQENNLSVFTPKTLKNFDFSQFGEVDVNIVVGYGLILPKFVIEYPKYQTINVHPSNLPKYRGAAPIERSLMAGENLTKSIIMWMDEGLDTGDILLQEEITIDINDDFEILSKKISCVAQRQILQVLNNLPGFMQNRVKQSDEGVIYAHKIENSEKIIDFNLGETGELNVLKIHNKIRGLSEYGVSFALKNLPFAIKIFSAGFENFLDDESLLKDKLGCLVVENKICKIVCENGYIVPIKIRRVDSGGKILNNREFCNGICNLLINLNLEK